MPPQEAALAADLITVGLKPAKDYQKSLKLDPPMNIFGAVIQSAASAASRGRNLEAVIKSAASTCSLPWNPSQVSKSSERVPQLSKSFQNDKNCNNSANTLPKMHLTRESAEQGKAQALGLVLAPQNAKNLQKTMVGAPAIVIYSGRPQKTNPDTQTTNPDTQKTSPDTQNTIPET